MLSIARRTTVIRDRDPDVTAMHLCAPVAGWDDVSRFKRSFISNGKVISHKNGQVSDSLISIVSLLITFFPCSFLFLFMMRFFLQQLLISVWRRGGLAGNDEDADDDVLSHHHVLSQKAFTQRLPSLRPHGFNEVRSLDATR